MEISLDILWYIIWQKHVTKKNAGFWNRYSTFCWTIIHETTWHLRWLYRKHAYFCGWMKPGLGWLTCPLFWSQFIITIWIYIQHMLSVCLIIVCIKSPGIVQKLLLKWHMSGCFFCSVIIIYPFFPWPIWVPERKHASLLIFPLWEWWH